MVRIARVGVVSLTVMGCWSAPSSRGGVDELDDASSGDEGDLDEVQAEARRAVQCGDGVFVYVPDSFASVGPEPSWPALQARADTWPPDEEIDQAELDLQTGLAPCGDAVALAEPITASASAAIPPGCAEASSHTHGESSPELSADDELIAVSLDLSRALRAPYVKSASGSLEACDDDCCGSPLGCVSTVSADTDLFTHQVARVHGFAVTQNGWLRIDTTLLYEGTPSSGEEFPGQLNNAAVEWQLLAETDPAEVWSEQVAAGSLQVDALNPDADDSVFVAVDTEHEYRFVITYAARATSHAEPSLCGPQVEDESFLDGHSELDFSAVFATCPSDPDLDGNGVVDGGDLGILLGSWGTGANDLNCDGIVDGADLGIMLGAWD